MHWLPANIFSLITIVLVRSVYTYLLTYLNTFCVLDIYFA